METRRWRRKQKCVGAVSDALEVGAARLKRTDVNAISSPHSVQNQTILKNRYLKKRERVNDLKISSNGKTHCNLYGLKKNLSTFNLRPAHNLIIRTQKQASSISCPIPKRSSAQLLYILQRKKSITACSQVTPGRDEAKGRYRLCQHVTQSRRFPSALRIYKKCVSDFTAAAVKQFCAIT